MIDILTAEKGISLNCEVAKNTFLTKPCEQDRINIETVISNFESILSNKKTKGSLIAVGGAIEKPFPRKDIDILVIIDSGKSKTKYRNRLEYARVKFNELQKFAEQIIKNNPEFRIAHTIEPTIDYEFDNPAILIHDGSVLLKKNKTTPIELLNSLEESTEKAMEQQRREFCILTKM